MTHPNSGDCTVESEGLPDRDRWLSGGTCLIRKRDTPQAAKPPVAALTLCR